MGQRKDPPKTKKPRRRRFRMRWRRLIWLFIMVGIIVPALGLGWGVFRARSEAKALKADFHAKNFVGLASTIQHLGTTLGLMRMEYLLLGWTDVLPVIRGYYLNGLDLLTAGHDELYVFGKVLPPVMQAAQTSGTTRQKSQAVGQAVTRAGTLMTALKSQLLAANAAVQHMNPSRMPRVLENKGLNVLALRSMSRTVIQWLPAMTGPHPVLADLLGLPHLHRYLLIFQNSGELRATGGFMTAYSYVTFQDGNLGKLASHNIEVLDKQVTYQPSVPLPVTYLPVTYWHLRDANTAMPSPLGAIPDVPEAVGNIMRFYHSIPNAPSLNGIVFVNTWFVDKLIADVGGLTVPTVPGKSIHLTSQNANFEMEMMAEGGALPPRDRKHFIGTMMKELLHHVFHGHMSQLLKVAGTLSQALNREQIMLNFHNSQAQHLVAQHNWGGIIPAHVPGNFVEVTDQNLLGHKDNYWMHESYAVNVKTVHGRNLETVTIHWVEPAIVIPKPPYLVVPYHSWVTVFAPRGSQYVSMTGSASGGNGAGGGINSYIQSTSDPVLNKEEFGAHMNLPGRMSKSQPPSKGTVVTQFWLPAGTNIHHMLLQKQPGLRGEPVTVTVNGVTKHITLQSRTWLNF